MEGFIDSRWEKIIRPRVPKLMETMLTHSCMGNFFKFGLVTAEEVERFLPLTDKEAAFRLLVLIFPRKGPDSYAKFLKALKATEGQEYIALCLEKESGDSALKPQRIDEESSASLDLLVANSPDASSATRSKETLLEEEHIQFALKKALKRVLSPAESCSRTCEQTSKEIINSLEKQLAETTLKTIAYFVENLSLRMALTVKRESSTGSRTWETISALPVQAEGGSSSVIINSLKKKLEEMRLKKMSLFLENIALRMALTLGKRGPLAPAEYRPPTWEKISALPVDEGECDPHNAAVVMNKTVTVRHKDWMLHWQLYQKNWNKCRVVPENINIRNVFQCGNRCCVIGKDCNDKKLKLYKWVHNSELQLIRVLPKEHQLDDLSAIGDERNNVYIVGGEVEKISYSKRVSCYNVDNHLWETLPDMPTGRKWCSLAILDNSLYVGGGDTIEGQSNLVECLPLSTGKWDTLPSTTAKDCKLTAFCGKIVATGGHYKSPVFEVYDELLETWLQLPSLNVGRNAHGVCVSGNVLLVVGGHRGDNSIEAFAV